MNTFAKMPTEYYPKQATRDELKPGERLTEPSSLPVSVQHELESPSDYIADDGLADALNVALILGQPLLLTGEPGTGKTQFAYSAGYWLGFERVIRFNVKSTTLARDFFYQIDEIRRFRDAQLLSLTGSRKSRRRPTETTAAAADPLDIRNYMSLGPLGEAILRANPPNSYPRLTQPLDHVQQERSIVLIDEIDKAPRDVPNDLLNEFENMEFEVPDLKEYVRAEPSHRPILIITSNSERNLPDAFLRRCIYYNIPFPGDQPGQDEEDKGRMQEQALRRIVAARLPNIEQSAVWLGETLELFRRLREPGRGLRKRPGTAELLNWLLVLQRRQEMMNKDSLRESPELFTATLPILMKNDADADIARRIYEHFRSD